MSTIHLHQRTTLTPEQYIAGLTDFGPGQPPPLCRSNALFVEVASQGSVRCFLPRGNNTLNKVAIGFTFSGRPRLRQEPATFFRHAFRVA
jgi:hypothetical protein